MDYDTSRTKESRLIVRLYGNIVLLIEELKIGTINNVKNHILTNYKTILDTPTRDNWFRMCYRCFPEKIVY